MPRVTHIQTNFTAGELSPGTLGRVDIERYPNGCKIIENANVLVQGGVTNTYGSYFVNAAKNANKRNRLIPFVYSTTQAYILEFGDLYLRFYINNARVETSPGVAYELATPYTEAMLSSLDYTQRGDTMFVFHPSVEPYRVRRFADNLWDAQPAPFSVVPFDEVGDSFATTLTLSATTGAITATASAPTWLAGDVGRTFSYFGGLATITSFTSNVLVNATVVTPFSTINIPANVWRLNGSPQATATPTVAGPVGTAGQLGTGLIDAFRATDVGKYVRINGGLALVTSFILATDVGIVIKQALTGTTGAPAGSWSLNGAMWSSSLGYPRCGVIHQQRLVLGGSPAYPKTVWGSSVGLYLDFLLTTQDDDAFRFDLDGDQVTTIRHLASDSRLIAFTDGGEFTLRGGVEKPITPTNIQVDNTVWGSNSVKPARVGKEHAFVQRLGLKLRALQYALESDGYDSQDLTKIADHISETKFVDISYAAEPNPLLYCVRTDGVMAIMTFSREDNVFAWKRRTTQLGEFESVATIPTDDGSQTWVSTRRDIPGLGSVRYIERLSPIALSDCALAPIAASPAQAVWPAAHLAGATVACIADEADMGDFVVTAGNITLPRTAITTEIGLAIHARIELLPPEMQTGTGSAQGNAMSTHEITVRLLDTVALKVQGLDIPFRAFGSGMLDEPPPVFTGLKSLTNLGWLKGEDPIVFTADRPLQFTLLSVVRQFTVNSGGSS
jgi:hypothetical protein